jgi:hypothetical protein
MRTRGGVARVAEDRDLRVSDVVGGALQDGLVIVDADGRIAQVNARRCAS